uniref:At2g35280-like TPR domain-containing protein n=1 Tax=Oryza brachyantha TaxID=4533 RepID=J3KWC3_ORYBR
MVTTQSMAARAKRMKRKSSPAPAPATRKELALCHDNAVHIACLVAATSPDPITDLLSLRATYVQGHARGGEGARRREARALGRLDGMKWLDNRRYLAVVGHLVGAGNPDACFAAGVNLVFARQDMDRGLALLDRAAAAGHKAAAYVLGLLLYASGEARFAGEKYIGQVEGDGEAAGRTRTNRECRRCRKIAEDAVREAMWKVGGRRGRALVMPEDGPRRTSSGGCGVESGWGGYGVFCSDGCRIRHEYYMFFTEVMNYMP